MKFKKEQRAKSSLDKQGGGGRPKSEGSSYSGSDTENSSSCHGGGGRLGPDGSPGGPMDCAVSKGDNLGGDPFIHQTQGSGKVAHHPQKPSQHLAHHQPLPDHCEQGGGGGHVMSRSAPIGQMTLPLGPDSTRPEGLPLASATKLFFGLARFFSSVSVEDRALMTSSLVSRAQKHGSTPTPTPTHHHTRTFVTPLSRRALRNSSRH